MLRNKFKPSLICYKINNIINYFVKPKQVSTICSDLQEQLNSEIYQIQKQTNKETNKETSGKDTNQFVLT